MHRALALGLALLLPSLAFAQETWRVDPGGSLVYALVYKDGLGSAVAHDHVVQASGVKGTITWDGEDPASSRVEVTAKVTDLVPDAEPLRKKVGLESTLSDKQRDEIKSHMMAKYQLYADQYNAITFASTGVKPLGGERYEVSGDFTIRGVTKRVTVPMTVVQQDDRLVATGKLRILQSDFGYSPYSALFGALRVKDEVDIVLNFTLGR